VADEETGLPLDEENVEKVSDRNPSQRLLLAGRFLSTESS